MAVWMNLFIRPLLLILPKMSGYIKTFTDKDKDKEKSKYNCFCI